MKINNILKLLIKKNPNELSDLVFQEIRKEFAYLYVRPLPKKILFDHLPKCGGTSFEGFLQANYPRRKTFTIKSSNITASIRGFKALSQRERYRYDLVKGQCANELLDYVHPECLKIILFREPVDRIISHYFYARKTPNHYLYADIHRGGMSLEQYVTSGISSEIKNYYTTRFSGLTLDKAEENPKKAISSAFNFIITKYDVIGFIEDLHDFTRKTICLGKLNFTEKGEARNVNKERPKLDSLEQSTLSLIGMTNHLDAALYKKLRVAAANQWNKKDADLKINE